jgi:hypothetical protein
VCSSNTVSAGCFVFNGVLLTGEIGPFSVSRTCKTTSTVISISGPCKATGVLRTFSTTGFWQRRLAAARKESCYCKLAHNSIIY